MNHPSPRLARPATAGRLAALIGLPLLTGCAVTAPLPTDAPIHEETLQRGGAKYFLYVPSTYDRGRSYPLVVACHGTEPWDTAWAQIREWAQFAERNDIIVAAPILQGTRGDFRPPADKQLALQRQDEQTILELVRSLKAARTIAEERVFLTGWSAGSFAVLHTGLRHPDLFRALAVRQGTFEPEYLDVDPDKLDRWQPIFVYYGQLDPLRAESKEMITALRERRLFVEQLEMPGSHRRIDAKVAWDFFRKIVRERPWIRLAATKPDTLNRRLVNFTCEAKPPASRVRWDFGDGGTSDEMNPLHEYADNGRFEVSCEVKLKAGKSYTRRKVVRIGPVDAAGS